MQDILAGKIKLQNAEKKRKESGRKRYEDSESESESEFECHDTTETDKYIPIHTRPEDELQTNPPAPNQVEDLNNNSGENVHTGQDSEVTEIETRKSKERKNHQIDSGAYHI